jgi:sulfopyruvate decarboxylase subunit beta
MTASLLRTDAVEVLAGLRADMLSVVTMQAVAPWNALGQADARNFNVTGCMGSAASVGLGLALARPADRVLVIDGDGSLLMQLASLPSIAERRPANLYHVVMENGIYETSGGQSVPGRQVGDLTAIALASGYRHTRRFTSVDEMKGGLDAALHLDGPVFISLVITGPGLVEPSTTATKSANKAAQIENMRIAFAADTTAI